MSDSGVGNTGEGSAWETMAGDVYAAVVTGDPGHKERAVTALQVAGSSAEEAETVYATAASIAQSAGSREAFLAVLKGDAEVPADLSEAEVEAFGTAWGLAAGGAGGSGSAGAASGTTARAGSGGTAMPGRAGRTWEGKGGNTWEGSAR